MVETKVLKFEELPTIIQDWISSLRTTYLIMEMNRRYGFKGDQQTAIPYLIYKLITHELDPKEFINELSHRLNISFSAAKGIIHEIEEKVLKPIEMPLRNEIGVDVGLIYSAEPASPVAEEKKLEETKLKKIEPEIKSAEIMLSPALPEIRETKTEPKPVKEPEEIKPPVVSEVEPFILHEEFPTKPREEKPVMKPSFVPLARKSSPPANKTSVAKPITAEIEGAAVAPPSPKKDELAATKRSPQRIVHYSGFKTPLSPFGKENQK